MDALPLKFAVGVYVRFPEPFTLQVPAAFVNEFCTPAVAGARSTEAIFIVPSRSVSLAVMLLMTTAMSSLVVPASLAATGGSFIGVTITVSVAAFDGAPALSRTI